MAPNIYYAVTVESRVYAVRARYDGRCIMDRFFKSNPSLDPDAYWEVAAIDNDDIHDFLSKHGIVMTSIERS
jgi:hypothetical protein